jgi:demethylmenaquinone methyltransferase/2-methoxy-6-polyprenyl-1,4-benzoquinol methylase
MGQLPASSEKPQAVHSIFSSIAQKYDLANDLISFGQLHLWRKKAVKESLVKAGDHVLDVATGTGDLALVFKKVVGESGRVIGVDFCQPMLDYAPLKAKAKNLSIDFRLADAMNLPYETAHFDCVSIAFGLRNVGDHLMAITDMTRVLKPGGRLVILETGRSQIWFFRHLFDFYFKKVMPLLGGLLTGQKDAYQYLDQSSAAFPFGDQLVKTLQQTGLFANVRATALVGGVSYIYVATKKSV